MYFSIVAGLILLIIGGDTLVRGSVAVARKLQLPELLIGIVLVGFGTSMPELITSVNAALAGAPGIAIGNVVGSNIANILLILGVSAVIFPIACNPKAIKRDGSVVLIATLCCVAVCFYGVIDPLIGSVFLALLIAYLYYAYHNESRDHDADAQLHEAEAGLFSTISNNLWLALLVTVIGIAITIYGAGLLVDGSIALARELGISETVIGLTIVAFGTSLPEFVTAVIAALRKSSDIALGNVLGSNIFNIWAILGITSLIKPIDVPADILDSDMWFLLGSALLLLIFVRTGHRICRKEGWVFIALYAGFIALQTA